jgi:hypothetical protein
MIENINTTKTGDELRKDKQINTSAYVSFTICFDIINKNRDANFDISQIIKDWAT